MNMYLYMLAQTAETEGDKQINTQDVYAFFFFFPLSNLSVSKARMLSLAPFPKVILKWQQVTRMKFILSAGSG